MCNILPLQAVPSALLCFCTLSVISLSRAEPSPSTLDGDGPVPSPESTRFGLFNLLDHRSAYGQGVFPEPFLVDDSNLETGEGRLDWLHTSTKIQRSDLITAEVEKGFELLTLELEVPFERDISDGQVSEGFGNIDIGARYPVFQYVSGNGLIDSTFGVGVEVGVPVHSSVSKNTELVPKVFNDLKLGNHLTLQSIFGYSTLFGGGDDGGLQTFEYGFVVGYTIQHAELPLPGVLQLIPMFELSGATELNKENRGHTSTLGDVGIRANLRTLGSVQPRLGVAFVFPLDRGAREDVHWGVLTSLVFGIEREPEKISEANYDQGRGSAVRDGN